MEEICFSRNERELQNCQHKQTVPLQLHGKKNMTAVFTYQLNM